MKVVFLTGLAALGLSACATSAPMLAEDFAEPREQVKILIMPPDIQIGLMTLAGMQSHEEWDQAAARQLLPKLTAELEAGGDDVQTLAADAQEGESLTQLYLLHRAIIEAVLEHEVELDPARFVGRLPHRPAGRLDYSLGGAVDVLADETEADYAAFLTSRATVESGGVIASKLLVGAVTGQLPARHGFHGTVVSLVELETGRLVWLGVSAGGDPRDPQSAARIIDRVFKHRALN